MRSDARKRLTEATDGPGGNGMTPEQLEELRALEAKAMGDRCGYAVIDSDGEQQPCDRPATDWRWYQDCEHEDALDVACFLHANRGGELLHAAAALLAAIAEKDEQIARAWDEGYSAGQRTDVAAETQVPNPYPAALTKPTRETGDE